MSTESKPKTGPATHTIPARHMAEFRRRKREDGVSIAKSIEHALDSAFGHMDEWGRCVYTPEDNA